MGTLFLDIGNSYIKAAEKHGPDWSVRYRGKLGAVSEFLEWFEMRNDQKIVISSVISQAANEIIQRYPRRNLKIIDIAAIPAHLLDYNTPDTLGVDRFLVCNGAVQLSDNHVVVIDSGSACTIDLMTADGVYRGGVIMPGMAFIREMMSEKLPTLPDAGYNLPELWPGKSTAESIQWGTAGMFKEAIGGFISKYRRTVGRFDLFVTGGGGDVISGLLGNEMEYMNHPCLLFEGMEAFDKRFFRE